MFVRFRKLCYNVFTKGVVYMEKVRLTEDQQKRVNWLIEQMTDYKEIDRPLVESLAFAIDNLEWMDTKINVDKARLGDKVFMSSRDKFVKQVENGLKMLDITPQARNKAKQETAKVSDPLTELLGDM